MNNRLEHDLLGEMSISDNSYWGIHTERALNNFNYDLNLGYHEFLKAFLVVKKACAIVNHELGYLDKGVFEAMSSAISDLLNSSFHENFPLSQFQGGAGTSLNMNMNEVIANFALEKMECQKGDYQKIHPIEHVNLHQSTNDVYPTALKIAVIEMLKQLTPQIEKLQGVLQRKEKEFIDVLMNGRTEMQDAVLMTLGAQFASFAEAISRDRWRTFKCVERIRMVNLGGTAIGTGITAPREYIFLVIEQLRELTSLGLTRAEHVMDQTANLDCFIEVDGMLATNASNIIKISQDLRNLHYYKEIQLPPSQAGSSIMPGKINPVILESVMSASMKVLGNHQVLIQAVSNGSFQINEFIPLVTQCIFESLSLLVSANQMLCNHLKGVKCLKNNCEEHLHHNHQIMTAFLPYLGYEKVEALISEFEQSEKDLNLFGFLSQRLGEDKVREYLSPEKIMSLGFKQ